MKYGTIATVGLGLILVAGIALGQGTAKISTPEEATKRLDPEIIEKIKVQYERYNFEHAASMRKAIGDVLVFNTKIRELPKEDQAEFVEFFNAYEKMNKKYNKIMKNISFKHRQDLLKAAYDLEMLLIKVKKDNNTSKGIWSIKDYSPKEQNNILTLCNILREYGKHKIFKGLPYEWPANVTAINIEFTALREE